MLLFNLAKAYLTSVAVTVFILPALFITICHVVMVVRIWQVAASTNRELTACVSHPGPVQRLPHAIYKICHEPAALPANAKERNTRSVSKPTSHNKNDCIQLATSPGCIPRARIKTVKMTLLIVSGKFNSS